MLFLIVSRVRKGDGELSDWRLLFHSWVLDLLQYELRATFLCRERGKQRLLPTGDQALAIHLWKWIN